MVQQHGPAPKEHTLPGFQPDTILSAAQRTAPTLEPDSVQLLEGGQGACLDLDDNYQAQLEKYLVFVDSRKKTYTVANSDR